MTLRVGVAEHPLPDLGQQGEPRARLGLGLGLGLLGLGIFFPFKMVLGLGMHRGVPFLS